MTELQAVHLLSGQKHSLFGSMCTSHTLLVPYRACNIACFLSPSNETGAVVTSASLSLVWGAQTFLLLLLFIEHFWFRQWKNWIFYSAVMTGWAAGLGVYRLRFHIIIIIFLRIFSFGTSNSHKICSLVFMTHTHTHTVVSSCQGKKTLLLFLRTTSAIKLINWHSAILMAT